MKGWVTTYLWYTTHYHHPHPSPQKKGIVYIHSFLSDLLHLKWWCLSVLCGVSHLKLGQNKSDNDVWNVSYFRSMHSVWGNQQVMFGIADYTYLYISLWTHYGATSYIVPFYVDPYWPWMVVHDTVCLLTRHTRWHHGTQCSHFAVVCICEHYL